MNPELKVLYIDGNGQITNEAIENTKLEKLILINNDVIVFNTILKY
jgi:hypothetical protein